MIAEGKSGSNGNTKVTDGSGLNFYLFWLCRNHAIQSKLCRSIIPMIY